MTTPTREQVIAWAREAGFMTGTVDYADGEGAFPVAQAIASGNCLHELVRLCTLAMSAGRAQGLREAKEVVERERVVEPSSTGDDYAAYDEAITDCAAAIEQLRGK